MSALVVFGVGCTEVDDPTLAPVSDPRFAEPALALRDLGRDPNRNVFWGDLHIHTSLSYDACTFGVRAMPTVLAFSDGEVVGQVTGARPRATFQELVDQLL